MIAFSILNNLFTDLFNKMDIQKIYTDVIILNNSDGNRFPVYAQGEEYIYVGIDDSKYMCCYIRQTSDLKVVKTTFEGGCKKVLQTETAYKLVIFNDYEKRNFDSLNLNLISCFYGQYIDMVALIVDEEKIIKTESKPKNFNLGPTSYFVAVDFVVKNTIYQNTCLEINCDSNTNPICKI